MDFSTSSFWYSLIPAIILLVIGNTCLKNAHLARRIFHKGLILLLSLSLLGLASPVTLFIFLTVTLTAWVSCKYGISLNKAARHVLLCILIPLLLVPLFYYKYADFVCNDIASRNWDCLRELIIPIGISFYTFQVIGFCIDTLRNNEQLPSFIDYMNFGSFFPQIVAGPIERRSDLLPQIQNLDLNLQASNLKEGIPYIILGLFFKLSLANNLADAFLSNYSGQNALVVWLNNLIFTFRIYFDFAGYGLTAYGLARCVGITLRMNFLSPYTAGNISDFWRRWHTSLTLWFRDYIYFPLGGSRTRRWALNLVLIFLISGIWHGAGWNFIIWGTLSGIAMVIHRCWSKAGYSFPGIVGWFITFSMMVFIWMFFYETRTEILQQHLHTITSVSSYDLQELIQTLIDRKIAGAMAAPFLLLSFIVVLTEYISQRKTGNPYNYLLSAPACGMMTGLLIVLHTSSQNQFIYFSF